MGQSWVCQACTIINKKPLALVCEVYRAPKWLTKVYIVRQNQLREQQHDSVPLKRKDATRHRPTTAVPDVGTTKRAAATDDGYVVVDSPAPTAAGAKSSQGGKKRTNAQESGEQVRKIVGAHLRLTLAV